jgi:hypothetical protein
MMTDDVWPSNYFEIRIQVDEITKDVSIIVNWLCWRWWTRVKKMLGLTRFQVWNKF